MFALDYALTDNVNIYLPNLNIVNYAIITYFVFLLFGLPKYIKFNKIIIQST